MPHSSRATSISTSSATSVAVLSPTRVMASLRSPDGFQRGREGEPTDRVAIQREGHGNLLVLPRQDMRIKYVDSAAAQAKSAGVAVLEEYRNL